jgi:hypothetical protein
MSQRALDILTSSTVIFLFVRSTRNLLIAFFIDQGFLVIFHKMYYLREDLLDSSLLEDLNLISPDLGRLAENVHALVDLAEVVSSTSTSGRTADSLLTPVV